MITTVTPGQTLRILLVTGLEPTRATVAGTLEQSGVPYQLHWVSQADLGLDRAAGIEPHLVLVNDDFPGATALALVTSLVSHMPDVSVVVMVDPANISLASQAVIAGARGFLLKPLRSGDLAVALNRVLQGAEQQKPAASPSRLGQIIVFCSPKGGTGRTTLAINSALALQEQTNAAVAIVDADYASPAIDVALNLHPARDLADLLPRLAQMDDQLVGGMLTEHSSGLQVLAAPPPGTPLDLLSVPQVQRILGTLRRMFPWVVVDLGLPFDEIAFAFLEMADRIVISVLPEMVGLRNVRPLLDQLHARGYADENVSVVINRASMSNAIPQEDIEARLGAPIVHCIPDDQPLVTYSVNRGVPVLLSHRRSALVRAYMAFAQRVLIGQDSAKRPPVSAPSAPVNAGRRLFALQAHQRGA